MEIILGIIAVIFIAITVALLALFYYMRKGVQFIRRIFNGEMTDEDVERVLTISREARKGATNGKQEMLQAALSGQKKELPSSTTVH